MYASPDETLAALECAGYFTDQKTATTVYLAGRLHRPIMLEGPAGAGKTELATSVSRAYGVPLLRLQCYQGINEEKAIGQYDKSLQELYVLLMSKSDHTPDWTEIKREVTSRAYFMAGPLLEAIEQDQRCVLLIDEIDKVDYAFEAMLLEPLSAWTLSIPKMGTVQATSIDDVIDKGLILFMSLNVNVNERAVTALGRMLLQNLQLMIGRRYSRAEEGEHQPFVSVIMDEFSPFAYENFAHILQTARGANVAFLFALQSAPQLLQVGRGFRIKQRKLWSGHALLDQSRRHTLRPYLDSARSCHQGHRCGGRDASEPRRPSDPGDFVFNNASTFHSARARTS
jgi:hypothetical protein